MYFDLEPKASREELFDFGDELGELQKYLEQEPSATPLIAITGHRRTGKSSLLKTSLNELDVPHLVINGRMFLGDPKIKKAVFMRKMEYQLNQVLRREKKLREKLKNVFETLQWVEIKPHPPWIQFRWEWDSNRLDPLDILERVNQVVEKQDTKFVFALGEAQEFARISGVDLSALLAYIYDNLSSTQVIVTGSYVRVFEDFLKTSDPNAPLFGRGVMKVQTPKLSEEKAIEYLKEGFKQTSLNPSESFLESAVERLDGVIGWLTLFGKVSKEKAKVNREVIKDTLDKGADLVAEEFRNFLSSRRAVEEYEEAVDIVNSHGRVKWTRVKKDLGISLEKKMSDSTVSELLNNLVKYGFLEKAEKHYFIDDPIFAYAVTENRI